MQDAFRGCHTLDQDSTQRPAWFHHPSSRFCIEIRVECVQTFCQVIQPLCEVNCILVFLSPSKFPSLIDCAYWATYRAISHKYFIACRVTVYLIVWWSRSSIYHLGVGYCKGWTSSLYFVLKTRFAVMSGVSDRGVISKKDWQHNEMCNPC